MKQMTSVDSTRFAEIARDHRWWSRAVALALGTFAVGTDAFVMSGLLPQIASSLQVSVAAAGQLVTVFSISYAVTAVPLGVLTASWPRRTVLIVALGVFALGNAATAMAPDYPLVLAARVVAAAGAALYAASATATAALISSEANRGRAIAIVLLGLTAALVLGAPAGTVVGSALGWRATLWVVAAMAIAVVPAIAFGVRRVPTAVKMSLRRRVAPLGNWRVLVLLARTLLVFIGIYLPYTFISVVTEPTTSANAGRLALLLLVFGVAATVGNLISGYLVDRFGSRRVIIVGSIALTVVFATMGFTQSLFVGAAVVTAAFGLCSFLLNAPQQHQLMAVDPERASVLTALYQSVLYLAVSASGLIGALILHLVLAQYIPLIAAGFTASAALITWRSKRENLQAGARMAGRNLRR